MTDVDYGGAAFPTSGWCHVIGNFRIFS